MAGADEITAQHLLGVVLSFFFELIRGPLNNAHAFSDEYLMDTEYLCS
jgi:hypothetical protein